MSPKQKFNLMLEPDQLAALKAVEEKTGAPVAAQIRLAVDAYLQQQPSSMKGKPQKRP